MRLIVTGCEYVGKHTLGVEISRWWADQAGAEFRPPPHNSFHDHFTLPHVVHAMGHESHKALSEKQIMTLNPGLLEHYQRYQIFNKLTPGYIDMPDLFLTDWYYSDAVYAPLYYGYGGPGEYADRRWMARHVDADVLRLLPDTVLVLMTASPEVIRRRFKEGVSPFPDRHTDSLLQDKDIELVLDRFQEEYDGSMIRRQFALDTTTATVQETLQEFIAQIKPFITPEDRLRILTHRSAAIDWL